MVMKITIITPCFNGVQTIESCISSIRSQTYQNIEHIVIDGGSSDGTIEILDRLNVRYVSGQDAGIYDAMNKGIAIATGEIIGILNCDDYYSTAGVISEVAETFLKTGCELCHGKIQHIDAEGQVVWTVGSDINRINLLKSMRVAHPSVFVANDVYLKYGAFSVGFKISGDYEFLLRVWDRVKIAYLDNVLVMMGMDGVSNLNTKVSYLESCAVAILHGRGLSFACWDYFLGRSRNFIVILLRRFGFKKNFSNKYSFKR
jgi:glycosyltransferase involved in cell wall biosynthesis